MLAIVSALSHPSVNRLTETWSRINAKDRKTFENLQKFAPEQEGRQLLQSIFQQIKVCNLIKYYVIDYVMTSCFGMTNERYF